MDPLKPWEDTLEPFRLWGNIYFTGGLPASVHIIDTGDGLILLDCGYQESLYLIINGMWRLGLDPANIKKILMTHGHIDHCGAAASLRQLTGCELYISEKDAPAVEGKTSTDLTYGVEFNMPFMHFEPDHLLCDGDTVTLGNTEIKAVATPGHTAGVLSYFFNATDGKRTLRAGLHGGAGVNSLSREYLGAHHLPSSLRDDYFDSCRKLSVEHVDIFLGNHAAQNATPRRYRAMCDGNPDAFVEESAWNRFLTGCEKKLGDLIEKEDSMRLDK